MSRRCVEVIDVVEILQHWYACRSKSQVAGSVGADRGTVAKYVAEAVAAGMVPDGLPVSRDEWVVLVRGWSPELVDAKARSSTYPEINRLRALIEPLIGQSLLRRCFNVCVNHTPDSGVF
jgi:hypothetical protein